MKKILKLYPLKLRTKIALYFLGLLILWSLLVIVSMRYFLNQSLHQLFREQGVQITQAITFECLPLVHYQDISGLNNLLKSNINSLPDIRYIIVLNDVGEPILSTFQDGIPGELLVLGDSKDVIGNTSLQQIRFRGEDVYDYECKKNRIRIRLGLSSTSFQKGINITTAHILYIGIAGLLAIFAIALYISKPIETLTGAIERAVLLDQNIKGNVSRGETAETTAIANRFHKLMNRLEERTKQLDASKKLAYLGEISASIAHEVNNPLGVIVMNSEFLANRSKQGEFTPAACKEVERLSSAAKRATLAVQKLLQFARYSTHDGEAKYKNIQLEPLIAETLTLLEDRIHSSHCSLHTEIPKGLPPILCDGQGIQQVLFNILTNAIDASPEGKQIGIRAAMNHKFLLLQVSDQGQGMSEDVLKRAKEPFFTTKDSNKGTGLGLAISDSIVRGHGGELILESRPDCGTTVTVKLPIKENM